MVDLTCHSLRRRTEGSSSRTRTLPEAVRGKWNLLEVAFARPSSRIGTWAGPHPPEAGRPTCDGLRAKAIGTSDVASGDDGEDAVVRNHLEG